MSNLPLYPLRFAPIYQYRIWGGRRLANWMLEPLPDGPVGEAWLLSDRDDHPSLVADGPLKNTTIAALLDGNEQGIMGKFTGRFKRFPLLLKFLDAHDVLSVQVHPPDTKKQYITAGESGKTEAWVVLETQNDSLIYAGLTPGTTPSNLTTAMAQHHITDHLHHFKPATGDSVLIKAGTVHSLKGLVVFEVQQNSDTTFRLFDWDRIDEKTGKPRNLQVDEALACIDYKQVNVMPVSPVETGHHQEQVLSSDYFIVWRHDGTDDFTIDTMNEPRILICIAGEGTLIDKEISYPVKKGQVYLLPAALGKCVFKPIGNTTLLQVAIPDLNPGTNLKTQA